MKLYWILFITTCLAAVADAITTRLAEKRSKAYGNGIKEKGFVGRHISENVREVIVFVFLVVFWYFTKYVPAPESAIIFFWLFTTLLFSYMAYNNNMRARNRRG